MNMSSACLVNRLPALLLWPAALPALLCALLLAAFFPAEAAWASALAAASQQHRLYIFLVDGLAPHDLTASAVWRELAAKAGMALLNTRTAGKGHPAATHLTIGAGAKADAPLENIVAGNIGEPIAGNFTEAALTITIAEQYKALTGLSPPPKAAPDSILVPSIAAFLRSDAGNGVTPGRLGQLLEAHDIDVALFGNSDTHETLRRHGALLVMNNKGWIPHGRVGRDTLKYDANWPFALRTDYSILETLLAHYEPAGPQAVIVVELGDLARLDAHRSNMSEQAWLEHRYAALEEIGAFIQRFLSGTPAPGYYRANNICVMIVSPTPRADFLEAGYWLAPLLFFQPHLEPGLLYSAHTKTPGLLTNLELGDIILALAGMGGAGSDNANIAKNGSPLHLQPIPQPATSLIAKFERLTAVHDQRAPLLKSYILLNIVVFPVSLAVFGLIPCWKWPHRLRRLWFLLLPAIAAFPLAVLIQPLFHPQSLFSALSSAFVLTVVLASAAWWAGGRSAKAFLYLFAATAVALLVDVWFGAPLMRHSVLGYDPIAGARYYGIGNEYMGVLLSAAIMTCGLLFDGARSFPPPPAIRMTAAALLLVTLVTVGAPWWGANIGGLISAVIGFAATWTYLSGRRMNWMRLGGILLLLLIALSATIALDLLRPDQTITHLGALIRRVWTDGASPIWEIAARKLAMNWKLFKYTIWTNVLLISLFATSFLLFRPPNQLRPLFHHIPYQTAAAKGALITVLVALVSNDSGVVAAATAMIPLTTLLLYHAGADFSGKQGS